MKLKRVKVENFAGCRYADLNAEGSDVIVLTGKNEQGKTSFLKAVIFAIDGISKKKAEKMLMPVHNGESQAVVDIETDDYSLRRKIDTEGNETLEVTTKEGKILPKPETLLKEKFRAMSINPLRFADATPQEQVDIVESVISASVGSGLPDELQVAYEKYVDEKRQQAGVSVLSKLDALDNNTNGGAYMRRRELRKEQAFYAENIGSVDIDSLRDEFTEIQSKIESSDKEAGSINSAREKLRDIYRTAESIFKDSQELCKTIPENAQNPAVVFWRNHADSIKPNIEELQKLYREISEKAEKVLQNNQELKNRSAKIEAKIEDSEKSAENREKLQAVEEELTQVDELLKKVATHRQMVLNNAPVIVPGLSIKDGVVYLGDVPYSQASAARRTAVSIQLGMAADANSDSLKLMLVENGAFIGQEIFDEIKQAAEKNGYTIIIEKPSDSDAIGFVFEAGNAIQRS